MADQSGGPVPEQFLDRLTEEVRQWRDDGTITDEQARAILDRYPSGRSGVPGRLAQGRLVQALAIVGAVLVGLGVILFFAANWDGIPRGGKFALLGAVVLGAHGLAYFLWAVQGYQRVGTAMALLAGVAFGAAVHLIGQAYHIDVNNPYLFLFWFLGVIPMAYVTRSQPVLVLALGLLLVSAGTISWRWIEESRDTESVLLLFALISILGLFLFAVSRVKHEFAELRPLAGTYLLVGLAAALFGMYVLSFGDLYDDNWDSSFSVDPKYWGVVAGLTGLAAVLLAAAVFLRRRRGERRPMDYGELAWAATLLAAALLVASLRTESDWVYPVVFNCLLALSLLALLVAGYLLSHEALINLAIAFIVLDIFTRYFEYSWSLFDRSLVFVVAGIILLVGGFLLERGRRRVLSEIRQPRGAA